MSAAANALTYIGIVLPLAIAGLTIGTLKTFDVISARKARGERGRA